MRLSVDLPCHRYITFSAGLASLEIYAARVCDELGEESSIHRAIPTYGLLPAPT